MRRTFNSTSSNSLNQQKISFKQMVNCSIPLLAMRSIPSLRIRARYAPGWRKSSRGCNAASCHRGNIIARFHVTHVPSDARTRFRSSWRSAIEAVHQGLRAMRFAVDEGTSLENDVPGEIGRWIDRFQVRTVDLPHPRDISRMARDRGAPLPGSSRKRSDAFDIFDSKTIPMDFRDFVKIWESLKKRL